MTSSWPNGWPAGGPGLYFWATYTAAEGESKPSEVRKLILADEFPME